MYDPERMIGSAQQAVPDHGQAARMSLTKQCHATPEGFHSNFFGYQFVDNPIGLKKRGKRLGEGTLLDLRQCTARGACKCHAVFLRKMKYGTR